ncbi:MAG: hypothetical protein ACD_75C00722G0001 [uncultured bacterium]|nr:MAG: hypothetical protein ACD_75C00722G0001 [uncultured bacterium]
MAEGFTESKIQCIPLLRSPLWLFPQQGNQLRSHLPVRPFRHIGERPYQMRLERRIHAGHHLQHDLFPNRCIGELAFHLGAGRFHPLQTSSVVHTDDHIADVEIMDVITALLEEQFRRRRSVQAGDDFIPAGSLPVWLYCCAGLFFEQHLAPVGDENHLLNRINLCQSGQEGVHRAYPGS